MKVKVTNQKQFNKCVVNVAIDEFNCDERTIEIELTNEGLKAFYPDNYSERDNVITVTGFFGKNDFRDLGFELI